MDRSQSHETAALGAQSLRLKAFLRCLQKDEWAPNAPASALEARACLLVPLTLHGARGASPPMIPKQLVNAMK